MNKQFLIVSVIISIITLLGFASAVWPFDKAGVQNSPFIKAHACNADEACEVNAIKGNGKGPLKLSSGVDRIETDDVILAEGLATGDGLFFGNWQEGDDDTYALVELGNNNTLVVRVDSDQDPPGKVRFESGVDFMKAIGVLGESFLTKLSVSKDAVFKGPLTAYEDATFYESVQFMHLGGNKTAYACLDQYGNLFRSMKPCV